jgi:hypothetical protein
MRKTRKFFDLAERTLGPEKLHQAKEEAQEDIIAFRLAEKLGELRETAGLNQDEIEGFTQSNVSRLENREDPKISTLTRYLNALGFGIEIRALGDKGNGKTDLVLMKIPPTV